MPSPIAGYYLPSKQASSISEAEYWIKYYLRGFTKDYTTNEIY